MSLFDNGLSEMREPSIEREVRYVVSGGPTFRTSMRAE